MAITPIARTAPLLRDPLFVTWERPSLTDFQRHRNVQILARAYVDEPNYYKPPGAGDYADANRAADCAKRVADWLQYWGYGSKAGGCVFLQNWGLHSTTGLLTSHADDAIGAGANKAASLICTAGIAACKSFTDTFLDALKAECDSRTLAYPEHFIWDFEPATGIQHAHHWDGATNDGWWKDAEASAKYNDAVDHPVYEQWNGTSWVKTSLAAAWTAVGAPAYIDNAYWFEASQRNFTIAFTKMQKRCHDYALFKSLYEPVKARFPNAKCSNYEIPSPVIAAKPFYDSFNPWLSWSFSATRSIRADLGAVTLYPPNMQSGRFEVGSSWGAASGTVYLNYAKALVDACIASGNVGVMPWIPPPGFEDGLGYTVTKQDVRGLMRLCYSRGIRTFMLWNEDGWDATIQGNVLDLIEEHVRWVRNQKTPTATRALRRR